MAGIFIDPAESFSKALGQGLSVFKGYRDEQRQDEDRAFAKQQALFDRQMKERMLKMDEETFGMRKDEFEYVKTRRPFKEKTEQAELDNVNLRNEGQRIQNEWTPKINAENIRSSRDASARGWRSLANEGARISLARQEYNDRRRDADRVKESNLGFAAMAQAFANPSESNLRRLYNNPSAARALTTFAAATTQSAAVQEAMRDPFGNWIRDPKKFADVTNYARVTPVFNATVQKYGFGRDTKVTGFRHVEVKGEDGKPKSVVEMTITGTRGGKRESMKTYARPDQLFETAGMAANIFGRIANDPVSKAKLGRLYGESDREGANRIIENEVDVIERKLKLLRPGSEDHKRLTFMLQNILDGNPETIGSVIFDRLGNIATAK